VRANNASFRSRFPREAVHGAVRAMRALAAQVHLDLGGDQRDTVFLAGSGRGGTTWIAEIINHDNAYRFIFEPFNALHVPICRAFSNRQYLRTGDARVEFVGPAKAIVSGNVRNGWTDFYNRRLISKRRLIKDIRAGLFLRWLYDLSPGMPIVLVLRHPCAVAASRVRYGWGYDMREFLCQDELVTDYLTPLRDRLAAISDPFEAHVARWCIENMVPLRQFCEGEIHVAFYEAFRSEPRREVSRLFEFLRRPLNDAVFAHVARPSSMAWESAAGIKQGGSRTDGWKSVVTNAQANRALEILKWFDLDRIYGLDPAPQVAAEAVLPRRASRPKDSPLTPH
jgi:sulfotransferase family protein